MTGSGGIVTEGVGATESFAEAVSSRFVDNLLEFLSGERSSGEVALIRKILLTAALLGALAPLARAQTFAVGGSWGLVNDATEEFSLNRFKPSVVTGWLDYRFEKNSLLRLSYGSMWTRQTHSEESVDTPGGPLAIPELKERVGYVTIGASYLFSEGFFTSGIFGGIGGYGIHPDTVEPAFEEFADRKETVFGWHLGSEAIFRAYNNVGIVVRLTYHNVSAHPHRQFLNTDAGVVVRF